MFEYIFNIMKQTCISGHVMPDQCCHCHSNYYYHCQYLLNSTIVSGCWFIDILNIRASIAVIALVYQHVFAFHPTWYVHCVLISQHATTFTWAMSAQSQHVLWRSCPNNVMHKRGVGMSLYSFNGLTQLVWLCFPLLLQKFKATLSLNIRRLKCNYCIYLRKTYLMS